MRGYMYDEKQRERERQTETELRFVYCMSKMYTALVKDACIMYEYE